MGKLQDFLMESDIRTEKTEVQIAPFPFPFVIQSITEERTRLSGGVAKRPTSTSAPGKGGRRLTLTCTTAAWLPPAAWNPTSRTPPCRRSMEFAERRI